MRSIIALTAVLASTGCTGAGWGQVIGAVVVGSIQGMGVAVGSGVSGGGKYEPSEEEVAALMNASREVEAGKHDWPDAPPCPIDAVRTGPSKWQLHTCTRVLSCWLSGAEQYRCDVERT